MVRHSGTCSCLLTLSSMLWLAASDNQHVEIGMTSSCTTANATVTRNVSDTSYTVEWKGDYPFNGNQNCKLKFQRMGVHTICISVDEFNMESTSSYLKYYKNNDTLPFKIYSKGNDPYTVCDDYNVIYVEIGDTSLTSSVSSSHVRMKIYSKRVEEGDDDDGINRWVLISIVATAGALFIVVVSVVLRYYCYRLRMQGIQGNLTHPAQRYNAPASSTQPKDNYGGQYWSK